ncbi:hypothetical protein [Deinococcus sp. UYEF24]
MVTPRLSVRQAESGPSAISDRAAIWVALAVVLATVINGLGGTVGSALSLVLGAAATASRRLST